MASELKNIKAHFIHKQDMRGRYIGWSARLGDIETNAEKTPQAAFDALMELAKPSCMLAFSAPITETYGKFTLVLWRDLFGFSYKILPQGSSCRCSGTGTFQQELGHARDHVAQLMMNDGATREDARLVAADKSLFDSLFPLAA